MSTAISGANIGFSGLAQIIARSGQVKARFDALTQQASSGFIAQSFSGLGPDAGVALSLGPEINGLKTAQKNIDTAGGTAAVTQTAMTRIQAIAADLVAQLPYLNGLSPERIDTTAANARAALTEVAGLLNSQFNGAYVFSGQDTANPPVPAPDQITSSPFYTQIATAVGGLGSNGAAATAASTLAIATSNTAGTTPFSAYLSQPASAIALPSVALGNGHAQPLGILANANTNGVSTGVSTTGSGMRDLMRALATIGALSSTQTNDVGFGALITDTQTSLSGAIASLASDAGALGLRQSNLKATQTTLGDTTLALTGQLAAAEDTDMTKTLSELTAIQTQLQASYRLISTSSSMSLVNFLPAG